MAINLDDRYPGRANGKTLDYPQGSFKNRTSPTSKDGTYLEQDWANDQLAFFQALMKASGLVANGTVDTAQASQYFNALSAIIGTRIAGFIPTMTFAQVDALTADQGPIIVTDHGGAVYVWAGSKYAPLTGDTTYAGALKVATTALAQGLADDVTALTPKKLADAFKGANQSLVAGGWYQKLPSGLIIQGGTANGASSGSSGVTSVTFPVAFPNVALVAVPTDGASSAASLCSMATGALTNGGFDAYWRVDSGGTQGIGLFYFVAWGY